MTWLNRLAARLAKSAHMLRVMAAIAAVLFASWLEKFGRSPRSSSRTTIFEESRAE